MSAAEKRERLRRFEAACREGGLSITVQRRVILEAVLDRNDHPTADQVYEDVKDRIPGVSRTTVYRVLETLVGLGVVGKAASPAAAARFDARIDRHHHLVCTRCGQLVDLDDDDIDYRIAPLPGRFKSFHIHDFSIQFHGTCSACRRKREGQKRAPPPRASNRSKGTDKGQSTKKPTSKRPNERRKNP